jgi:hypothetical protein
VFRGRAFGLDLEAPFDIPGLLSGDRAPGASATTIALTSDADIDRAWATGAVTRTLELAEASGKVALTIDHHPELGYRVWLEDFGTCVITSGGEHVDCALPAEPAGRWRLLIGQGLPIASALRGYEVLHASAVEIGGRAAAFTAAPGVGKTTLAFGLALDGASLLADDVVALEASDSAIQVHPGAGVANLSDDQAELIGDARLADLGEVVDRSDKLHLAFSPREESLPLAAIYFLEREPGRAEPGIERLAPQPAMLLGSTYVSHVRTPERLINQLTICSRVAELVPLFRVRFDAAAGRPDIVRAAVGAHAEGLA